MECVRWMVAHSIVMVPLDLSNINILDCNMSIIIKDCDLNAFVYSVDETSGSF